MQVLLVYTWDWGLGKCASITDGNFVEMMCMVNLPGVDWNEFYMQLV